MHTTLAKAPDNVNIADMDDAARKAILRRFPYGLYAVTVAHDGDEHGMTANWVTQAAFEPPMVVVAVENTSKTIGMIRDAHYFGINLLEAGQRELAEGWALCRAGPAQAQGGQDEARSRLEDSRPG